MLPSDFSPERVARQRFFRRERDLREGFAKRVVVELGKNPQVKKFVKKAFPQYRKRRVTFRVGADSVTLGGGYWDGGSRTEWFGIRPDGSRYPLQFPTAPPQFGGGKEPTVKITDDKMVAEGGTSFGKPATLTFHVTSSFAQSMGVAG